MKNKRGQTINERLNREIEFAKGAENKNQQEILAIKALGAADLAVEFGLITYKEWEFFVSEIFQLM